MVFRLRNKLPCLRPVISANPLIEDGLEVRMTSKSARFSLHHGRRSAPGIPFASHKIQEARLRGHFGISGGDREFAYMLQAAAWLASQALRISHAMSAWTSLVPDKKQKARLHGLLDISGGDGSTTSLYI